MNRLGSITAGFFVSLLCIASLTGEDEFPEHGLIKKSDAALRSGDYKQAAAIAKQLSKMDASNEVTLIAADTLLRCGEPAAAVKLFDDYLEKESASKPYLWQRGIALYFAGDFEDGAKQFEIHRAVNPNDVENAAWHYLCVSKAQSVEKAKANVLPAPNDPRVPMGEVLEMLSTGDSQPVIDRIESTDADTSVGKSARFYGYLYLGLYADAHGKLDQATKWMQQSAADAPRHYMGDVARVYAKHLEQLQRKESVDDNN